MPAACTAWHTHSASARSAPSRTRVATSAPSTTPSPNKGQNRSTTGADPSQARPITGRKVAGMM